MLIPAGRKKILEEKGFFKGMKDEEAFEFLYPALFFVVFILVYGVEMILLKIFNGDHLTFKSKPLQAVILLIILIIPFSLAFIVCRRIWTKGSPGYPEVLDRSLIFKDSIVLYMVAIVLWLGSVALSLRQWFLGVIFLLFAAGTFILNFRKATFLQALKRIIRVLGILILIITVVAIICSVIITSIDLFK